MKFFVKIVIKNNFEKGSMCCSFFISLNKSYLKYFTLCDRCGGNNDVTIIHVNDEPKAYCQNCRVEMFSKKNPVGRPAVGVTKKSFSYPPRRRVGVV